MPGNDSFNFRVSDIDSVAIFLTGCGGLLGVETDAIYVRRPT